jgi:hypothetical protein
MQGSVAEFFSSFSLISGVFHQEIMISRRSPATQHFLAEADGMN